MFRHFFPEISSRRTLLNNSVLFPANIGPIISSILPCLFRFSTSVFVPDLALSVLSLLNLNLRYLYLWYRSLLPPEMKLYTIFRIFLNSYSYGCSISILFNASYTLVLKFYLLLTDYPLCLNEGLLPLPLGLRLDLSPSSSLALSFTFDSSFSSSSDSTFSWVF